AVAACAGVAVVLAACAAAERPVAGCAAAAGRLAAGCAPAVVWAAGQLYVVPFPSASAAVAVVFEQAFAREPLYDPISAAASLAAPAFAAPAFAADAFAAVGLPPAGPYRAPYVPERAAAPRAAAALAF